MKLTLKLAKLFVTQIISISEFFNDFKNGGKKVAKNI